MDLKYARLLDFCFICGLLGHSVKEYSSEVDEEWRRPDGYRFGNWLRAATNSFLDKRETLGKWDEGTTKVKAKIREDSNLRKTSDDSIMMLHPEAASQGLLDASQGLFLI